MKMSGVAEVELVEVVFISRSANRRNLSALDASSPWLAFSPSSSPVRRRLKRYPLAWDLFESVLEDKDGDGPWRKALSPPAGVEAAIAGYIWGGLGFAKGPVCVGRPPMSFAPSAHLDKKRYLEI